MSCPSPRLPTELLVCIVDHLVDDTAALQQLSLVNTGLSSVARSHRFASIQLDWDWDDPKTPTPIETFISLVANSPSLVNAIRKLRIGHAAFTDGALPALLVSLPLVTHLELVGCAAEDDPTWSAIPLNARSILTDRVFSSIHTLSITSFSDIPYEIFCSAVQLNHLAIYDTEENTFSAPLDSPPPPHVTFLECDRYSVGELFGTSSAFGSFVRHLPSLPSKLCIRNATAQQLTKHLPVILNTLGGSLLHLELIGVIGKHSKLP